MVPRFFVPACRSENEAAEAYATFVDEARHPIANQGARLFRISFQRGDQTVLAQVGEKLQGWPEAIGPVLAIIETTRVMYLHLLTEADPRAAMPLLVSPEQVIERIYFDDYTSRD